ncbi:MAG: hypothetical protein ABSG16_13185 [Candidatus Acidiferrum sp.]
MFTEAVEGPSMQRGKFLMAVLFSLVGGASCPLPAEAPEILGYHAIRVDRNGDIAPWYGNGPSEAYDHDIRLVWNFWRNMRNCANGVPYYLQHQVWKAGEDDPRGLGGDQISMALSSWNLLYGYLGDAEVQKNMVLLADYWLAHGLSSADALWPNLPYPYNTDVHSGRYDGDMRAGRGVLQPDKAGSFAAELVVLYKITGQERYLQAAVKIADTLAGKVQAGDAQHSPWPFRVNAATGLVHQEMKDGQTFAAAYTTNWTPTLRLFAELTALKAGDAASYRRAAQLTVEWLKTYPLRTNVWGPFFEDVGTADFSNTEINADTLAFYILEHPEWDKNWQAQTRGILDWPVRELGNHDFAKWHVTPINEQTVYREPGQSHTARYASVELLYCEKTGDCSRKAQAIRALNWATYAVDVDGANRFPHDDIWLTDGYGDYIRHYLRAMAEAPELAPEEQNHLLRTSSVIQSISYRPGEITYTKFDAGSSELFKLGAALPASIAGGSMRWDARRRVLHVTATSKSVTIALRVSS